MSVQASLHAQRTHFIPLSWEPPRPSSSQRLLPPRAPSHSRRGSECQPQDQSQLRGPLQTRAGSYPGIKDAAPPVTLKVKGQTCCRRPGCEPCSSTEPRLPLPSYLKDGLPVRTDARPEILKKCSVIPTPYVMLLQAHTDVMNTREKRHSYRPTCTDTKKTRQHPNISPSCLSQCYNFDPNTVTARNTQAIKMLFLVSYTALSGE